MANINENELTREQIEKAMACKTAEDLIALAKSEGVELTKEEAEVYMAERDDFELDSETLSRVAGGINAGMFVQRTSTHKRHKSDLESSRWKRYFPMANINANGLTREQIENFIHFFQKPSNTYLR